MSTNNNMEETWGIAATHAEHSMHDSISYSIEGQTRTGTIIWICAPTDQANKPRSVRYVVQPDESANSLDLVWPGNVLIDAAYNKQAHVSMASTSVGFEEALLKMLASLSIPVILKVEIDDDGQPFYIWQIGQSTPTQPFGMYVGTNRQLIDALKLALEKLIRHVEQQ